MPYNLSDRERTILLDIRDHGDPPEARRAQIILLSAEGTGTAEIAEAVSLSTGQVRYWRRVWRDERLGIFPDLPDAVPPAEPPPVDTLEAAEPVKARDDGKKRKAPAKKQKPEPPPELEQPTLPEPKPPLEIVPLPGIDGPRLPLTLQDEIGMHPDDPMAEAGRKALLFHFERMLLNEPGSRLGKDIEAVHDMRVATRRMRSAFRLFGPFFDRKATRPYRKELRRVAKSLGRVRDLDVFMEKAERYLADHPDTNLTPLFNEWNNGIKKSRRSLVAELDSKRFSRFVSHFHAFLVTPGEGASSMPDPAEAVAFQVRHIAPRLIYERFEQVRAYETVMDNADLPTLHALRIDFKRLRYTLEFFREVLGPEIKQVIDETKTMQDHLGDLNDTVVAIEILREFVDQHREKLSGVPQFMRPDISGVSGYLDAKSVEKNLLLGKFPEMWDHFLRDEVRRDLALAVSVL
ncbi:MAG: CHAD domain-containing protein [Anaerolineae bacterium]|nr:CHAD domain-containing protein [Anaerolineae bacterium]